MTGDDSADGSLEMTFAVGGHLPVIAAGTTGDSTAIALTAAFGLLAYACALVVWFAE